MHNNPCCSLPRQWRIPKPQVQAQDPQWNGQTWVSPIAPFAHQVGQQLLKQPHPAAAQELWLLSLSVCTFPEWPKWMLFQAVCLGGKLKQLLWSVQYIWYIFLHVQYIRRYTQYLLLQCSWKPEVPQPNKEFLGVTLENQPAQHETQKTPVCVSSTSTPPPSDCPQMHNMDSLDWE